MTRRVLLGSRSGSHGLWVSRPSVDVLTATADDLIMSPDIAAFQIVASGTITSPANLTDYNFTIPNLGFSPLVLLSGSHSSAYSFPNATTLRIHVFSSAWGVPGNSVTWAVTNQRILH